VLGSVSPGVQRNEDGATDIYFGPEAPAGHESNWLETPAGSGWWPWFRFFGPEEALFEKTWNLPDIERLK
jgi:hypothetical protein